MARPVTYRRVGEMIHKSCSNCKHFTKLSSWCKNWNFVAKEDYVCNAFSPSQVGITEEENIIKQEYRVAIGSRIKEYKEHYAVPKVPKPDEDDYEIGYIYRYFAKQSGNVYGEIVEIDETQFDSFESESGLDNSHYDVARVQWVISGKLSDVRQKNTKSADYIERKHPNMIGLGEYLSINLTRFHSHWVNRKESSD